MVERKTGNGHRDGSGLSRIEIGFRKSGSREAARYVSGSTVYEEALDDGVELISQIQTLPF